MTKISPEEMIKRATNLIDNMKKSGKRRAAVGLLSGNAGSKAYKSGQPVIRVGTRHEYGVGVPKRSFLRMPFEVKADELNKAIALEWRAMFEGKQSVDKALGRVGVTARNIVKAAFQSEGFGRWKKSRKTDGQTLVDTRLLGTSVSWDVRNV